MQSAHSLNEFTKRTELLFLTKGTPPPNLDALLEGAALRTLCLKPAPSMDVSALEQLPQVGTLVLEGGAVTPAHVATINRMPGLKKLVRRGAPPSDLAGLARRLEGVSLESKTLEGHVSFLGGVEGLETLWLGTTHFSDLASGLPELPTVKHLRLASNAITDLTLCRSLPGLRSLEVPPYKGLTSAAGTEALELTHVSLVQTGLRDPTPLLGSGLRALTLTGSKKIRAARGAPNLELLCLFDTAVTSVGALSEATSLERLDLRTKGGMSELDGLEALTELRDLRLRVNGADISALFCLEKLESLTLAGDFDWDLLLALPHALPSLERVCIERGRGGAVASRADELTGVDVEPSVALLSARALTRF